MSLLVLLAPAANRVYAGEADRLVAAELALMLGTDTRIAPLELAGIGYLQVDREPDARLVEVLGRLSGFLAAYDYDGARLGPVVVTRPDRFDDDLVTIPKYPGKTNEQFTRLLVNVTLAAMDRPADAPLNLLDPVAGRGTTLSTGLTLGHHVAGVEADEKALEAYAAFLKTYLRRKRLKHTLDVTPVRREGRSLGHRIEGEIRPTPESAPLSLTMFSGDTRQSGALFGRRRFDAIIADAPYGVVHGSRTDVRGTAQSSRRAPARTDDAGGVGGRPPTDMSSRRAPARTDDAGGVGGRPPTDMSSRRAPARTDDAGGVGGRPTGNTGRKDRSAGGLLADALPVWAGQLKLGGALGLSWNTHGLTREKLLHLVVDAGLEPLDGPEHRRFDHRVDSSIQRDILLARRPRES